MKSEKLESVQPHFFEDQKDVVHTNTPWPKFGTALTLV